MSMKYEYSSGFTYVSDSRNLRHKQAGPQPRGVTVAAAKFEIDLLRH